MNLNNPLISRFKIEDRIQMVEYEDLPIICYQCGRFGHVADTCDCHQTDGGHFKRVETPATVVEALVVGQHHGPWMHVMKRGRKKFERGVIGGKNGCKDLASRYDVLANLGEDWVEGGNRGYHITNQNLNEKTGNNKDIEASTLESGKQTFTERDFRGADKGEQRNREGGRGGS